MRFISSYYPSEQATREQVPVAAPAQATSDGRARRSFSDGDRRNADGSNADGWDVRGLNADGWDAREKEDRHAGH
jgi:hypothetical protein